MPPLSVRVDNRGWLGTQDRVAGPIDSVRLAAAFPGPQALGAAVSEVSFDAIALPTATAATTTTTTIPPTMVPGDTVPDDTAPEAPMIDPDDFGTDRPTGLVEGILFAAFVAQGVPPNQANCAIESVPGGIENVDTTAVLGGDDAAAEPVIQALLDCGVSQEDVDVILAALRGG